MKPTHYIINVLTNNATNDKTKVSILCEESRIHNNLFEHRYLIIPGRLFKKNYKNLLPTFFNGLYHNRTLYYYYGFYLNKWIKTGSSVDGYPISMFNYRDVDRLLLLRGKSSNVNECIFKYYINKIT